MAFIVPNQNTINSITNPNEFGSQGTETLTLEKSEALVRDSNCNQFKDELNKIKGIKKGESIKQMANEFEDFCFRLLSFLLSNDFKTLSIGREQRILLLGDKVKRNDIEVFNGCNPKANSKEYTIWNTFLDKYNCQKLVFECKRYTREISSKEIYQLFEYLHPSRVGKIGFIINLEGGEHMNRDGKNTLSRIENDEYKIIIIGKNDLITWIDSFNKTGYSYVFLTDIHRASLGKTRT